MATRDRLREPLSSSIQLLNQSTKAWETSRYPCGYVSNSCYLRISLGTDWKFIPLERTWHMDPKKDHGQCQPRTLTTEFWGAKVSRAHALSLSLSICQDCLVGSSGKLGEAIAEFHMHQMTWCKKLSKGKSVESTDFESLDSCPSSKAETGRYFVEPAVLISWAQVKVQKWYKNRTNGSGSWKVQPAPEGMLKFRGATLAPPIMNLMPKRQLPKQLWNYDMIYI